MTPQEAYNLICDYLKFRPKLSTISEYTDVYGFRLRPGELLCVIKNTGEVIWEDKLPVAIKLDNPKQHILGKIWEQEVVA